MFTKLLIMACLFNVVNFSKGGLAPLVTKCKADDAACITANAVKLIPVVAAGIPDLDVQTLDPSYYDFIDASKNNLKFLLNKVNVTGLSKCKALDVHREKQKSKLYVKLSCSSHLDGLYELEGELLTLKMEGHGNIHVSLPQYVLNMDIDLEEQTGNDGKRYFHIPKFDYTFDLLEQAEVVFENLFTKNEELKKPVAEIIKTNGNEIVKMLGGPIFDIAVTKIVNNFDTLFKKFPIEELALD